MNGSLTIALYRRFTDAEQAIRRLAHSGFPMDKVSLVGRDWRIRRDGAGPPPEELDLFETLTGSGIFLLPTAGAMVALGPLAGLVMDSTLAHGLTTLGLSGDDAAKVQSRLESGEYLVLVSGEDEEIINAKHILGS